MVRLRRRQLRRAYSLRVRLLAALIGLLAVVCLVVGLATELALRQFLIQRLDTQLVAANGRTSMAARAPDGDEPPGGGYDGDHPRHGPGEFLLRPGQSTGTLVARVVDGELDQAAVLDPSGTLRTVDGPQAATLAGVPADGHPHSRDLGPIGNYRLLAQRAPDGDMLVTGLPLTNVRLTLLRLAVVEGAVAALALISAGFVGASIIRRTLRPLDRVAATAGRVATLPLDRGEVALAERVPESDTDPRTEAGRVGAALNRLLNHVDAALTARQASETRVRQFVADASHELRTPLAAIRGYAELTRRSGAAAPPDVTYALGRVESEAARMTTLVEDLLLLARLDAGRPLAAEVVDLVPLVVHAVSDAHVAGPGHDWQLDLPDDPVQVIGDGARLHQVVANLLANARTHTPQGTRVTVGVRGDGDLVRLTVADNGPGIPPELLPHVFQRFARGDESRSRTAGSTGLGLAIVDAVVSASGGRVDVDSDSGGTTFTVTLPAMAELLPSHSRRTGTSAGDHSGADDSAEKQLHVSAASGSGARRRGTSPWQPTRESNGQPVYGVSER